VNTSPFPTWDAYQEWCVRGAGGYPHTGSIPAYAALAICGEIGELSSSVDKAVDADDLTPEARAEIVSELGDVLWYIASCAADIHVRFSALLEGVEAPTAPDDISYQTGLKGGPGLHWPNDCDTVRVHADSLVGAALTLAEIVKKAWRADYRGAPPGGREHVEVGLANILDALFGIAEGCAITARDITLGNYQKLLKRYPDRVVKAPDAQAHPAG
jgi:NTP pyrophosphatase (non-canonical NTP hydrolase)